MLRSIFYVPRSISYGVIAVVSMGISEHAGSGRSTTSGHSGRSQKQIPRCPRDDGPRTFLDPLERIGSGGEVRVGDRPSHFAVGFDVDQDILDPADVGFDRILHFSGDFVGLADGQAGVYFQVQVYVIAQSGFPREAFFDA